MGKDITKCPDCGAQLEFKGVGPLCVWHEKDGWKVYDARCPDCGTTRQVVGDRAGPADGYPRGNRPPPKLNGDASVPESVPQSVPKARAKPMTIVVPLRVWLGAVHETSTIPEHRAALLGLLDAAEAANRWFQDVYPPESFNGSSGDTGAVRVVDVRDQVLDAVGEVQRVEVPVPIKVRGQRSCSAECPWHTRYDGFYREQEASCRLFNAWLGLVGSRVNRPMARCQQCAKARVIGKGELL